MTHLDYLCSMETIREILQALPPDQLSAVALRWEGLNNIEIAGLLGVTHQAVALRISKARARIATAVPEARAALEGRKLPGGRPRCADNTGTGSKYADTSR